MRLRVVGGRTVALCAARSVMKEGDVYLDDGAHAALADKFAADFASEGFYFGPLPDKAVLDAVEQEESNNRNRDDWDQRHAEPPVPAGRGRD